MRLREHFLIVSLALGVGGCTGGGSDDSGGTTGSTGSADETGPTDDGDDDGTPTAGDDDDGPGPTDSDGVDGESTGDGPPDGPVSVMTVVPAMHAVDADRSADISVAFAGGVDASTVTADSFVVHGRWTGRKPGAIEVANDGSSVTFSPATPFMAGEEVVVRMSTAIQGGDGQALPGGFEWRFWTAPDAGSLDLTRTSTLEIREPGEGLIQSYGAMAGDLNGDGYSDLMIPNELANDIRIFLNDGAGGYPDTFETIVIPGGSVPSANEGADLDGDGDLDFFVGSAGSNALSVFMGDGAGSATHDANYAVGQGVRGVCILDLNADGAPDAITASRVGNNADGEVAVLMNDGAGQFEVTETINPALAVGETDCALGDANLDGHLDVFIGTFSTGEVWLFLNDGEGSLTESGFVTGPGAVWRIVSGDIDNDGNIDAVWANWSTANFSVVRTDGEGNLIDDVQTYAAPEGPISIDMGDLDGDGDLEVVTSNLLAGNFSVFENLGDGTFGNMRTLDADAGGSCAVMHDRDNDGDLDMTAIDEVEDRIYIFDNQG
ncbi:MAG: FG-GAP-like repeat-containing protein [Myxococcota bacterium]